MYKEHSGTTVLPNSDLSISRGYCCEVKRVGLPATPIVRPGCCFKRALVSATESGRPSYDGQDKAGDRNEDHHDS